MFELNEKKHNLDDWQVIVEHVLNAKAKLAKQLSLYL